MALIQEIYRQGRLKISLLKIRQRFFESAQFPSEADQSACDAAAAHHPRRPTRAQLDAAAN